MIQMTANTRIRREFDLAREYFGGTYESLVQITADRCGVTPHRVVTSLAGKQKKEHEIGKRSSDLRDVSGEKDRARVVTTPSRRGVGT